MELIRQSVHGLQREDRDFNQGRVTIQRSLEYLDKGIL